MLRRVSKVTVGVAAGFVAAAPMAWAGGTGHDEVKGAEAPHGEHVDEGHGDHPRPDVVCSFDGGDAGVVSEITGESMGNMVDQAPVAGNNIANLANCSDFLNNTGNGNLSGNRVAIAPPADDEVSSSPAEVPSPVDDELAPPVDDELAPPAEDELAPPVEDELAPPAEDELAPPADDELAPPAEDEIAPPAEDELAPPAEDELAPPAEDELAPPAEDELAPPAEDELAPPAEDEVTPPAGDELAPPADAPTAPAEGAATGPTPEDIAGFPGIT